MTDMTSRRREAHPTHGGVDPGRVWKAGDLAMVDVVDVAPTGALYVRCPRSGKIGEWHVPSEALRPLPAPAPPKGRVWVEIEEPPEGSTVKTAWCVQGRYQHFDVPVLAVHRAAPDAEKAPYVCPITPEEAGLIPVEEASREATPSPLAALRDAVVEAALAYRQQYCRGASAKEWGALNTAIDALRAAMPPPKDPVRELREAWEEMSPLVMGARGGTRLQAAIAAIAGRATP